MNSPSSSPSSKAKINVTKSSFNYAPSKSPSQLSTQRNAVYTKNAIGPPRKFPSTNSNLRVTKTKNHPSSALLKTMSIDQQSKEIESIKLQTQEIDHEKLILRTQTAKMRRMISDRNASIKKVFTATTKNEQSIQTASASMMVNLKKNYESLKEEKKRLIQEFENCLDSDNYWASNELLIEVKLLYEDQERLKDIVNEARFNQLDIQNREKEAKLLISKATMYQIESEMNDLNDSINVYKGKCQTYDRGKAKTKNVKLLSEIQDQKISIEDAIESLEEDIDNLKNQISINELTKKSTDNSIDDALEQMNIFYNDAILKINHCLNAPVTMFSDDEYNNIDE